jgi:hypothetical protein
VKWIPVRRKIARHVGESRVRSPTDHQPRRDQSEAGVHPHGDGGGSVRGAALWTAEAQTWRGAASIHAAAQNFTPIE